MINAWKTWDSFKRTTVVLFLLIAFGCSYAIWEVRKTAENASSAIERVQELKFETDYNLCTYQKEALFRLIETRVSLKNILTKSQLDNEDTSTARKRSTYKEAVIELNEGINSLQDRRDKLNCNRLPSSRQVTE